jgi:hypothetical protein
MARRTRADREQEWAAKEQRESDRFVVELGKVNKFVEAQVLVFHGPRESEPGRRFYSNLGFFLMSFGVPFGSNNTERQLYIELIQRFDAGRGLKLGTAEKVIADLHESMKDNPVCEGGPRPVLRRALLEPARPSDPPCPHRRPPDAGPADDSRRPGSASARPDAPHPAGRVHRPAAEVLVQPQDTIPEYVNAVVFRPRPLVPGECEQLRLDGIPRVIGGLPGCREPQPPASAKINAGVALASLSLPSGSSCLTFIVVRWACWWSARFDSTASTPTQSSLCRSYSCLSTAG